jgi:signal transduction histidine kinase
MPVDRPTVLILSTNPAFVRAVAASWPSSSESPEFTVLEETLFRDLAGHYDLAIADAAEPASYEGLKQELLSIGRAAILVHADSSLPLLQAEGRILSLRGQDGLWPTLTGFLGREMLARSAAEACEQESQGTCAAAQSEAVLGRYIVEMRHNISNALTSLLGNAELLTLEPSLPANVVAEADTIRNMALRLHEIFKRFSSLEKELLVAARETSKRSLRSRGASAGI